MITNLVLVGFMGSGKSTVGRLVARWMDADFLDTDDLIVQQSETSVSEIFHHHGEVYFRDLETAVLKQLVDPCPLNQPQQKPLDNSQQARASTLLPEPVDPDSAEFEPSLPLAPLPEETLLKTPASASDPSSNPLIQPPPIVLATGGGILGRPENAPLLHQIGLIGWLDGNSERLFERASRNKKRPLLNTQNPRQAFEQLYQSRKTLYQQHSDFRIDTTFLSHEQVTRALLRYIRK